MRRPTMQDIADAVGMSRQVVSVVLRGTRGATDQTRARVLAAAQELGYHPDDSARALRRRRSGQIGVLFTMRQPFEVDLVDALYNQATRLGYTLVLSTMSSGRSQTVALEELMRQRIEALIVLAAEGGAGTISGLPSSVPIVLLGGPTSPDRHDDVRVENESGIAQAVDHLVELGHRRIAYVGQESGPNAAARFAGYRSAMAQHGLAQNTSIIPSDYTEEGGHSAAVAFLQLAERPTAVVCANDRCAFGLLETLVRADIHVPEDLSVVGFDDSSVARLPFVNLTTVHPDPERMAALAIEAAHRRLQEPDHDTWSHTVPASLVVRGSTRQISN